MNVNLKQKYYLFIPILLAFLVVVYVTLSNNWPFSWDIYTHINYALAYVNNGITNVDPFLNAPKGKQIGYPPLFHIILILFACVFKLGFINAAKLFQILFSVINMALVVYVGYKLKDELTGIAAGLLLLSSFMFTRMILPIPETVALIFFTLSVYLCYQACTLKVDKYAIFAGICALLMLVTHFSTFVYFMILITVLMLGYMIVSKNMNVLRYYLLVIIPVIILGVLAMIALAIISPSHFSHIFSGIYTIATNPMSLFMGQVAMGLERYIKCIGILPLVFSVIGLILSVKNKEFLFVTIWGILAFLFSNLHWFGIPVYTFRMLVYLIIPMVILGGYAVSVFSEKLQPTKKNFGVLLIIALIILSVIFAFTSINDDSFKISSATTEESSYQIAPPTSDEEELINWFNTQDNNKSVLINNLYLGTVISSVNEIPLHYSFDVYTNKTLSKSSQSSLEKENIGYIVYDKKLVVNNTKEYDDLHVEYLEGSYYPSYYFTKKINKKNFDTIELPNTKKVFENDRFIVSEVI